MIPILFLISCESDPCGQTICLNNGICNEGICDCQEGYSGDACDSEIIPTSIKIIDIEVVRYPATDSNGADWDSTSEPDLTFKITRNGNDEYDHNFYYEDVITTTVNFPIADQNVILTDVEDSYTFELYDYDDLTPSDFMGGVTFLPYSEGQNFPETVNYNFDASEDVAIRLTYEYTW